MLAERKKEGFLPTQVTRSPFLFPRFSLSSFPPSLSVSGCELARRAHGQQTGFAIKRILSRNVRDQRKDLTYNAQTGFRSFHFSLRVLFLLPPPARSLVIPVISSNVPRCSFLRFSHNLFRERYALPLAR